MNEVRIAQWGVIPTGAVFQAEGGISRESPVTLRAGCPILLSRFVRTRVGILTSDTRMETLDGDALGNLFYVATH